MNLQDYLPVPSIPIHYHKVIFLAASEKKLSLYSPIPPIPDKRGLNDIPSGPFKNPIVYRIFERMSSHDERTLKQFMLELNSMKDPEERLAFLDKSPQIRSGKLLREERLEEGPKLLRIDPSECGALAFYPTIFVSRFIPPLEYLNRLVIFKWQSYLTFITGILLLIIVYYYNSGVLMVDKRVLQISPLNAILISLASLGISWFIYDFLCKSKLIKNNILFISTAIILSPDSIPNFSEGPPDIGAITTTVSEMILNSIPIPLNFPSIL